jgi:hypothetical protein
MRSSISGVARVVVLSYAAVMAGCGGPETGTQVKVTDEEIQKRTQGINDAMKAGMYDTPTHKPSQAKKN